MKKSVKVSSSIGSFSKLLRDEAEKMSDDKVEVPKCFVDFRNYHGSVIPPFSKREKLQFRLAFLAGCC